MKLSLSKAIFLTCLTFLVTSSCTKQGKVEEKIRPVLTETVRIKKKEPSRYFSGFSKAEKFINLSFRVGGLIDYYPLKVGAVVNNGDLLAKLDDKDYQLEVNSSQAALDKTIAEAKKTSAQYLRIKSLYESESASRDELDEARAAHQGSKAAVVRSQSMLKLSQKQLSYTRLYAEEDGCEVSTTDAEIYENVEPGQTISVLTCGSKLEIEIAVPETEIATLKKGESVGIVFHAYPDKTYKGTVTEIGVDASGGTAFPVTILLDDKEPKLRSGMAAKVIFYGAPPEEKDLVIVPLDAVGEDMGGNYVYIYHDIGNGEGIAKKQSVEIGEFLPGGIIIRSGLEPGEQVIIAGLRYLHDGRKVKLLKNPKIVPERKE